MTQDAIRVLLVEDNPGDARLVEETLGEVRSPRFELTHVADLEEARRNLVEEHYDAVLLDLMLRDSPRLGTLLEMPDHASRAAVIVFTGLDEDFVESFALGEGAQDYLVKGKVNAEELVASIHTAVERHKTGNGPARHPASEIE
jgi:DNA-binding response OmpR family regulator